MNNWICLRKCFTITIIQCIIRTVLNRACNAQFGVHLMCAYYDSRVNMNLF